jgi:ribonuclease BN (tRNA processing enzyme)
MFTENSRIRLKAKELIAEATTMSPHDIPSDGGTVDAKGGVKVTAFLVNHADATPAYGYRIDEGDHAVVLSGDTTYAPNVIRHAQSVELLVHCVTIGSQRLEAAAPEFVQRYYTKSGCIVSPCRNDSPLRHMSRFTNWSDAIAPPKIRWRAATGRWSGCSHKAVC